MTSEFHKDIAAYINSHDVVGANAVIMRELGKNLVHQRKDFVDMLNNAGVAANYDMDDYNLVELFIANSDNKDVRLGAAYLVNLHNKVSGLNGEDEVSDTGVKAAYRVMNEYWGDYSPASGYSNAGGIFGGIIEGGVGIANKVIDNKNKKQFGALDALTAQQQAKQQMAQSVIDQRNAQLQAASKAKADRAKNIKIAIYVGAGLAAIAIGVGVYLYVKKNKKK